MKYQEMEFQERAYERFMAFIAKNFEITTLKDAEFYDGNICMLRHDVDHRIDYAIEMAKIDNRFGISSTFFVLPGAEYYNSEIIEKLKVIQGLGHEIGLHNDIITKCIQNKSDNPEKYLVEQLNFLRRNGIKIYGTSSHGHKLCRRRKYRNYQIFKNCVPPYQVKPSKIGNIPLYSIDLENHDLYEAYFLSHECYIADIGSGPDSSRGTWYGSCKKDCLGEWAPGFLRNKINFKDFINKILKGNISKIQLNAHAGVRTAIHYEI